MDPRSSNPCLNSYLLYLYRLYPYLYLSPYMVIVLGRTIEQGGELKCVCVTLKHVEVRKYQLGVALEEARDEPCGCLGKAHSRQSNGRCKGPGGEGSWPDPVSGQRTVWLDGGSGKRVARAPEGCCRGSAASSEGIGGPLGFPQLTSNIAVSLAAGWRTDF